MAVKLTKVPAINIDYDGVDPDDKPTLEKMCKYLCEFAGGNTADPIWIEIQSSTDRYLLMMGNFTRSFDLLSSGFCANFTDRDKAQSDVIEITLKPVPFAFVFHVRKPTIEGKLAETARAKAVPKTSVHHHHNTTTEYKGRGRRGK